jgi:hypothetical protein
LGLHLSYSYAFGFWAVLLHAIHEDAQRGSIHQKSLHQKQLQVQTNPNRFHLVGILLSMLLKQHASDVAKAFSALIMVPKQEWQLLLSFLPKSLHHLSQFQNLCHHQSPRRPVFQK